MRTLAQSASSSSARISGSEVIDPCPISVAADMMVIVPSGAMLTQGLSALPVRSLPTLTFAAVDRVAEDPGPVELASHADRDLEVQALADGGATAERPRDG